MTWEAVRYCDECEVETAEGACFVCGEPTLSAAIYATLKASRFSRRTVARSNGMTVEFDPELLTVAW